MARAFKVAVLFGVLVALLSAIGHHHLEAKPSSHGNSCVYCTGAMASAPETPLLALPAEVASERPLAPPGSPALSFALPLAHSGCAPPV